ncbi:MAG: hypothetical protein JKY14_04400 [Paraglaciecola sp.]|nr:hypothetical protein [Paraglaciecola sp.]
MIKNDKIVEEIVGCHESSMDFVFAADHNWELDLFLSRGASRFKLAQELPTTKVKLFSRIESEELSEQQNLILPDLGHLSPGGIVLSKLAVRRLEMFWLAFGELLPLDVEGDEYYYYNVTNILENVVDIENSLLSLRGKLETPAFLAEKIPSELTLLKVPEKKCINLYATGGFSALMRAHGLKIGVKVQPVWSKENGSVVPVKVLSGYTGP